MTKPISEGLQSNGPYRLMPAASRYDGQAIDTTSRHSISIPQLAESTDQQIPESQESLVVDYFYHAGHYWRARIFLNGVEQVSGQTFNFSKAKTRKGPDGPEHVLNKHGLPKRTNPCLIHVQSRFQFSPQTPIELYDLDADPDGSPTTVVNDMVYSLEAVGPPGIFFGLRDGMAGNLISAHRILSTQEMVFERIVVENQVVVESPPLPLDQDQRRRLLVRSLIRSHQASMSERYYMFRCWGTNNCTSNPFRILDETLTYRGWHRVGAFLYRLPLSPRFYLRARGLDSDPNCLKIVRNEFADFIAESETQQRKREYVRQMIKLRRQSRSE